MPLSANWVSPSSMYFSVLATVIVEPLSAFFVDCLFFSDIMALLSSEVKLEVILSGCSIMVFKSSISLRYFSNSLFFDGPELK